VKELEAVVDQLVLDGVLERTSNEEHFTVRRKGIAAAAPPPPPLTKAKAAIMPSPPKAIARPASPRPLPSEKERLKLLKRVLLAVPKVKDGKVGVSTLAKITHKSSAEVDEMVHILLENGIRKKTPSVVESSFPPRLDRIGFPSSPLPGIVWSYRLPTCRAYER
jgi:hypothetical protein